MATKTDPELTRFQNELLESVRQMKRGEAARTTQVSVTVASQARMNLGITQARFAEILGVSLRTLQDWEQGRREPSGAARTLLRIAKQNPEAIHALCP